MSKISVSVEQLRQAVCNAGPSPRLHARIMKEHRTQWPTLWAAIDALLEEES